MRRRTLLYALLALAVPLPALALSGGNAGAATISVSASLDGCGTATTTIMCKIDATWNAVPGATRYTATLTTPDGSVMDAGEVGSGSASFWVPYAGNGTYTVTVSAHGTAAGENEPEVIAKGSSSPGGGEPKPTGRTDGPAPTEEAAVAEEPVAEEPPPEEPIAEEPVEPPCEEPPVSEPPAEPAEAEGSAGVAPATQPDAAAETTAAAPEPAECAEPEPEPAPAP